MKMSKATSLFTNCKKKRGNRNKILLRIILFIPILRTVDAT